MYIGKLVNSSSHIEYLCQIYNPGETEWTPDPVDYGFGTFVGIERSQDAQASGSYLVGVIYNTTLLNPEFGTLGPRLSPEEELAIFSPDYLHEKVTLVAIFVLGEMDAQGRASQGVPAVAATIDARVRRLSDEEVVAFHRYPQGSGPLRLAYLPSLATMNNPLAPHLALAILSRLRSLFPREAPYLAVLENNLAWKSRVEPVG
ncbi:MAG: hypothetical protein H5T69_02125 [Chloroflexi bacterium]|nr:hypothetical protein [Chloroflexota bacterium]